MNHDKLIRTLNAEVRVVDQAKGIVDYIASDETLDAYNEVILAKGWKFTHFAKNSPFVDTHDYCCIDRLLGKVISWGIRGKQLVNRVQWAIDVPSADLARLGWEMTVAGYLRAVSVGFEATRSVFQGAENWATAVREAGLDVETAAKTRRIFQEQEQLELSAVILGANPNALLAARKAGAAKEDSLRACGFGDAELDFLTTAASGYETRDTLVRQMIGLQMRSIYATRPAHISKGGQPETPDAGSASRRSAADQATRIAAERRKFLEDLGKA
jgi:hypothetical protein